MTTLSTREVADLFGVDTEFVRDEIKGGRLECARQFSRPGGRTYYRVAVVELRAYCEKYCPRLMTQLPAA